jgi:hypothetical protein
MPKTFDADKYRETLVKSIADAIAARDKVAEKITGKDGKDGLQAKADKANKALEDAKADGRAAEGRVRQTKAFLDAHDNVAGAPVVSEADAEAEHDETFPNTAVKIPVTVPVGRPVKDNPQA